MPNDAGAQRARPGEGDPRFAARAGAALRTRTGVGLAALAVLAVVLATGSLLGGAGRPADGVAAASPSAPAASPPAASPSSSAGPSQPPGSVSAAPESAAPPSVDPSATPVPATPAPTPTPTPTPTPSLDPSAVPARALQARLDRLRVRLDIPGVSVAIVWDDGRQWLGASGYRDLATADPMTTGTAFALASVSKTLTAGVVLQLAEEGRLSLGERVAPLLPAYDIDRRITVRQLLDHTSGIPDYFLNGKIDRPLQRDKHASWSPEQTWTYVAPPLKRFRPGRVWLYSNSNYLLLGELVEAVTGRSLAKEIRRRILDPLQLETAWYQGVEKPRARGTVAYRLLANAGGGLRAVPVAKETDVMPFRSVVTAAGGAGSIAATALDAARWMRAFAGGDVLGPEMQRELIGDVATTRRLRAEIPYGLGIQALPIADRFALGHSGRFLGFRNVVRYLPDEGVTIAVLTNQGVRDPARIAEGLLRLILPPLPEPVGPLLPSPAPSVSP